MCQRLLKPPHLTHGLIVLPLTTLRDCIFGYLLTSPETYLKRLLSEYHCPLHAIGKAYRANEEGSEHAIEFTMLEWYRPTTICPFQAMVSEMQI